MTGVTVRPAFSYDAFDIPPKNAPVESLRRWRQAALVLNLSRRFRYALDLKKEEEKEKLRRKIRAQAQVIRAVFFFLKRLVKERQQHPSGSYGIGSEQLTAMSRDQDLSSLQGYGGIKGLSNLLTANLDKVIVGSDTELLQRRNAFGVKYISSKEGKKLLGISLGSLSRSYPCNPYNGITMVAVIFLWAV